ncbi:zinc finger protein 407 [Sorex araneus]|uniref:zinc finger protein 407 n=1 Tax=Sorex araneus TaxID=42254 RepID=UPI0024338F01|nr:zinc finger protein 407 [Sorex araneus]
MMETEKKPEVEEDEDGHGKAECGRGTPSHVHCGSLSEGRESPENSMGKRGFSEAAGMDSAAVEEDGQTHASKRMRLATAEPRDSEEQGVGALEGAPGPAAEQLPLGEGEPGPFPDACSGGRPGPAGALSPSCGFNSADAVPPPADTEQKSAEETGPLDPGGEPPGPPREASGGCATGNGDLALTCSMCGHLLSSCCDVARHADCPVPLLRERACCRCAHLGRQTPAPQNTFACDLCGFQCVEENRLNAHYLGKTHLRRQKLAARGGFVQILTKQPFPKKTCATGTKTVRTKPRALKPLAKSGESEALPSGDLGGSLRAPGGGGGQQLVDTEPAQSALSDKAELAGEALTPPGVAPDPKNHSTNSGAFATEGLSADAEPRTSPTQAAPSLGSSPRPRPERSLLTLGSRVRRRSGTFTLKAQAKKRFGLLGISKRGAGETQRMYLKHIRTQVKASGVQPGPPPPDAGGSVRSLCVASAEAPDPKQDKRSSHLLCPLDSWTARPASDHQVLCACTDCGQVAVDRTELDTHMKRCHAGEMAFPCQACGFSCMSQRDLDEHLHSNQHQQTASVFSCQCCSFISLNEINLRDHMKEKHSMGFLCLPCNLFFLSEKDVEEHRATEEHLHLLVQTKTSQALEKDLALQNSPLSTLESENAKEPLSGSGKTAQEEPGKSRVGQGNDARHSSKPQFQCKKCFYKTRSSTVLTRHIKLRHGQDYHFLCKACNLYSLSREGMEKHIKRSKHLENAKKNNIGLSFEECIERVWIGANDKKEELSTSGSGRLGCPGGGVPSQERSCPEKGTRTSRDLSQSGTAVRDEGSALDPAPKRGRPKGSMSRTCSHCGLLASSITNLTVHIRRKHSHQYSYLCKVCKYYTVTKGDMERHCATKKHKGRVEVEASGKQSSDIIVGPEVGKLEAWSKNASSAVAVSDELADQAAAPDPSLSEKPAGEQGASAEVEVGNVFRSVDGGAHSPAADQKEQTPLEPEDLPQHEEACAQRDVGGTGDNKCIHCDFNTHSCASLELHIKRKHTKEFAFYCMACDYYAVTRREMMRHAATEKHKLKRHAYLDSSSSEAAPADMASSILPPELHHHHHCEDVQVIPEQQPETLKPGPTANPSVSEENDNSDAPAVLCASLSAEVVTPGESNLSEDQPFCETLPQPLVRDKMTSSGEMLSLQTSSDLGSSGQLQNENPGGSALDFETAKRSHHASDGTDELAVHCEADGAGLGDGGDTAARKHNSAGVPEGGPSAGGTSPPAVRAAVGELCLQSDDQNRVGPVQSSEDLKNTQENPALENKEMLTNSQRENKVVFEEDGPASDSRLASGDVYETIISIDEKGQTMYGFGRFDSSIIRIKSPEDGELVVQPEEGLLAAGVRVSELPFKDCAQGLKKKKPEGSSFGESTRIRCDDCGFLADGLSGLNVHIAMKHPTKEKHFHCLLCGKSFYTESNLHQHLASAGHLRNEQASVEELPEGGATFKCVKCTEPFDSEQSLFLHIKGQHEELLREVNKYIVEDTEQINREREENQGNVCKYCGKMCRSSNSMAFLAHIRTHTGSKPFKCKICHFATAQLGDARNHVKRHLGMREYKCHVCGVAFVMKKHLNTHLLGKHGVGTPKERKFTCHLCDRSFTEKWALNNHMKLHTGEKPFKCTWPTCHYSFLTASAMKDHYRTHTGEKSFLCDLCGFAGGTRHALTKHRRQHTGEKPFKCDECNFASTTQSHLTRHKRVHTGEKPYRCPWCDYRSNCAENIRKHILHTGKHEGVRMYNCPKCDYGTNVPVEFRNHLKEQHPDIENPDLAYLHAGIVSKSYECRLKGQGATFVETDSPFTAAALADEAAAGSSRRPAAAEEVQQLIIIQGYDGEFALDASAEDTAAATLQTLALAGQVARVVHVTEDGQVIAGGQGGPHGGGGAAGALDGGVTQVVVVGSAVEGPEGAAPLSPGGAGGRQAGKPEPGELAPADPASALDALLCAVTELGGAEDKGPPGPKDVLQLLPGLDAAPGPQDGPAEPPEGLSPPPAPQGRAQALRKVVQGVLQLAVCGDAAKEGVTQVILNPEGAVHMVARDGPHIIVQGGPAHPHAGLAAADGEISQIIVTEELVQAVVREAGGGFPDGPTHYIVTELPPGAQDPVFSHTVIEAADSQELLQAGVAPGAEPLTSMVIYTQDGAPAATVIQSQRDGSEAQEA